MGAGTPDRWRGAGEGAPGKSTDAPQSFNTPLRRRGGSEGAEALSKVEYLIPNMRGLTGITGQCGGFFYRGGGRRI